MSRERKLPAVSAISSKVPREIAQVLGPLKQIVEALQQGGIVSASGSTSAGSSGADAALPATVVEALIDSTTPPAPTGVAAQGGLALIIVSFDKPSYRNHAYTEVWRADSNDFSQAVLVGTTQSTAYTDSVGGSRVAWYWLRHVSSSTPPRSGPFNSQTGTRGETGQDAAYVLDLVKGKLQDVHIAQVNAAKVAGTLKDWQIEAVNASKLAGQLVDSQLAGINTAKLIGQVEMTQLASSVQGNISSSIQTANQALSTANNAATASSLNQVNARLAPGGDIYGSLVSKAPQASLDAAVTRIATAEAQLGTKAAASAVEALQAEVSKRKTYRLFSRGNSFDGRFTVPFVGIRGPAGTLVSTGTRSYVAVRFNAAGDVVSSAGFDVYGSATNAIAMADHLNAIPAGDLVCVYGYDEPNNNHTTPELVTAMLRCGASPEIFGKPFKSRAAYAMFGKAATNRGTAHEVYVGSVDSDPAAYIDLSFDIVNGTFAGISPSSNASAAAALSRVAVVESTVAGKASASDVTTLQVRLGTAEANVTTLASAQATLDGRVSGKWGVAIEATLPDGRKKLSGLQAFNDGTTSSFVISADQLLVQASGAALNPDPSFADRSAWQTYSGSWQSVTIGDGAVGVAALRSAPIAEVIGMRPLPFDPRKTYRVHGLARGAGGANGMLYLGVQLLDGAGQNISGNGSFWYTSISSVGGSWTEFNGFIGPTSPLISPSHARSFRPIALVNYGGTAGYMELQDLRVEEVIPGTLIKPGEITTAHLIAQAVTAEKLAVSSIQAQHIQAGAIVADKLAAGAITAASIKAGEIQTAHFAPQSITTDKIAAGAISASQLASLSVTSDKIAALAVSAEKIQSGSISADKLSVTALSAISANVGTLTAGTLYNSSMNAFINLNASGSDAFISTAGGFRVNADGSGGIDSRIIGNVITGQVFVAFTNQGDGDYSSTTISISHTRGRPVVVSLWRMYGTGTPVLVSNDGGSFSISADNPQGSGILVGFAYM
ncbi:MAG: interleukin-like EMT inducer domain-containing protein [Vogesella sp.]|uniref:interleukin-like EMT inducer domain-containing protein n=1 Tax=Vogesella sp. TaxID=1904252 RepID=UPI003F3EDB03